MKTKTMICWEVRFFESLYSSYILKVLSPNGFDYIFYLEFNYEVLIMLFCLFFVNLESKSIQLNIFDSKLTRTPSELALYCH